MATFVLAPGAWLGGWAWDTVTATLRAAGHEVHPVTLTGLAGTGDGADADLDTHTDDLVRLLTERDLREVVLVAHSYAGLPASAATVRVPDRIARLVYVDSGPLPDGTSQFDLNPPEEQERLRTLVDHGMLPPPPWDPAADPNLAGLDQAALAWLRERSVPHPFASLTQPFRLPGRLSVPVTLVACVFPLDQVRAMIEAGHPFFAGVRGADLRALPTGHWPMFSEPHKLAALLTEVAATAPAN